MCNILTYMFDYMGYTWSISHLILSGMHIQVPVMKDVGNPPL